MNPPATPEERRTCILNFIKSYIAEQQMSPTIREISEDTGLAQSVVFGHLKYLESIGAITRTPATARSIKLLEETPSPLQAGRTEGGHNGQ